MSRLLKLKTNEIGTIGVFIIYKNGCKWEEPYDVLRGSKVADLLPVISLESMTHALAGWTKPFVMSLGLDPKMSLVKMPRECSKRAGCPFYDAKDCVPTNPWTPTCFNVEGMDTEDSALVAYEIMRHWQNKVYVVVVEES